MRKTGEFPLDFDESVKMGVIQHVLFSGNKFKLIRSHFGFLLKVGIRELGWNSDISGALTTA